MQSVRLKLIPVVMSFLALMVAACNDEPTRPPNYSPYPQQLFDISADSHFVYFRDNGTASVRPAGIYRFRIEGDTAVEPVIVASSVYFPRVSPNGKQLAFVDLANALIIRDLVSGRDSVVLHADVIDIGWYNHDTLVCETYTGRILVVDIAVGGTSEIWKQNGRHPAVAPEGTVAFIQYFAQTSTIDSSRLFLTSISGDTIGPLATFTDDYCYGPDLSITGDMAVLVRDYLNQPRLALVTIPDGTLTDSLVRFGADPFFTQDGRILYVLLGDKGNSQKDQIWRMDSDGSDKELLMQ